MNIEELKHTAISYILSLNRDKTAREIYQDLTGNFTPSEAELKAFRRYLADWKLEFNKRQVDLLAAGKLKKEAAVIISSTKGGGYYPARTLNDAVRGYKCNVATISTQAEGARIEAKFIELAHNQRHQQDLDFSKEPIKEDLFN